MTMCKLVLGVNSLACLAMGFALSAGAAPSISGVKAQQRYPWNGKVDIIYTASGVEAECQERSTIEHATGEQSQGFYSVQPTK